MKKLINLILIFILLSASCMAYDYWTRASNSHYDTSLGINYNWVFSSPIPSQHLYQPVDTCTITNANIQNTLVYDVNSDHITELLVFDSTHIYVYDWNCQLLKTITNPETILQSVIIAEETSLSYGLVVDSPIKMYLYNFDSSSYLYNSANITNIASHGTAADHKQFACGTRLGTTYSNMCLSIVAGNFGYVSFLNNLTQLQKNGLLSGSPVNFPYAANIPDISTGTQMNYINSMTYQEIPINYYTWDGASAKGQGINLITPFNLSVNKICSFGSSSFHTTKSQVYAGWGSDGIPDRIFWTGENNTYTAKMLGMDCTSYFALGNSATSVSNFALTDFDSDGSEEANIIIYNLTVASHQFLSITKYGGVLRRVNMSGISSSVGYKTLVMADMIQGNGYKELITEDGIWSFDGINFNLTLNITGNRGAVDGSIVVAYTDTLNAVNRAVYTDSSKITIFGYKGGNELITYLYCGDNVCNNAETIDTCPVDCDPYFKEGSVCYVHATPPCIYETYFEYANPIKIQDKGFSLFFHPNTNLYTTNGKLDFNGYNFAEEIVARYIPYTPSTYYTMEYSVNMRDTKSSLETVISESGTSLDIFDRIDFFIGNGSIDYYYTDSTGSRSLKNVCTNCVLTNEEQDYKIYFFFADTPLTIFDNTTNVTDTAKKNTYAIWQDGSIIKANIPFLNTQSLEDNYKFDHIQFGVRNYATLKANVSIDNIYLYEGSNNATSNVDQILVNTLHALNQTTTCVGGFCKKGGGSFTNWDCGAKPQCCGIRYDGSYGVTHGWCVIWTTVYDAFIAPLIEWAFKAVIIAIILLFVGGTIYILWLRANKPK